AVLGRGGGVLAPSMGTVQYREGNKSDIDAIARIRASEWEAEEYWITRIMGYMDRKLHPQKALAPRVIYVALKNGSVIGFIARHFYARHGAEHLNEHWMVWNNIHALLREEPKSR